MCYKKDNKKTRMHAEQRQTGNNRTNIHIIFEKRGFINNSILLVHQ